MPAGASTDFIARLMAAQIGLEGVDTVVENRPGASGMIGTEFVSRQPHDGNTILVTPGTYLIDAQIRKAKYHPVNDFEPLCSLAASPSVLMVPSSSPYRTLADFLSDAAARPEQLSVAALGPNSASQLGLMTLARESNTRLTFVPFPGSAPAVTAVLGSHVTAAIAGYSVASEAIKSGHLRALAVAADSRAAPLPEVPTFAESGFPTVRLDNWFGAVVPAKTPADTTNQLIGWLTKAIGTPEVKQKLELQGLYPELACGSDFAQLIRRRYEEYGEAIKQAGLKSE
ncbi:Bug family tripartite tricarboxylate transporter substrate binding protein [Rhodoplanes sp. Z2-YC6860]|uniref:Bug family tripartite tricarboxylate transporter substrate binding protein n=1 Tax=Rhodoplanes sp. Z2-YC6860 TaxID=674703 RepID=UPI0018DB8991|nr:tripartite tricarboxylate transporter substrate binding protein [Rhodoplanes sp. Z2-YC6860]